MWIPVVFFLMLFQWRVSGSWENYRRVWGKSIQDTHLWMAKAHDPTFYKFYIPQEIENNDVTIPAPWNESPDFRLPEPPWQAMFAQNENYNSPKLKYKELNRPYRIFPIDTMIAEKTALTYSWHRYRLKENVYKLACICCTVYKRLTPLGICAIISAKHLLTTATSTELVLRRHPKKNTLENILGAYYHATSECNFKDPKKQHCLNSSTYMTPSRIHFHPLWLPPDRTNRSHPLPTTMDLALWVATFPFIEGRYVCYRGTSSARYITQPSLISEGMYFIVGVQFVWDLSRRPMPWFMYAVKTRLDQNRIDPCPKVEWGWFLCIQSRSWAQLGLDSGAALWYNHEDKSGWFAWNNEWKESGLVGLNVVSMKLRSDAMVHYFQPIDIHPVLDWLYSAYNGRLPYRFLDSRFNDTQWGSPKPKPWAKIVWGHIMSSAVHYYKFPNSVWGMQDSKLHYLPWH